MPNWCFHSLKFKGENKEKAIELFNKLIELQSKNPHTGVLPEDLYKVDDIPTNEVHILDNTVSVQRNPYMFDLRISDEYITYNTKWSPNEDDICLIADHFKCDFELFYEELGHDIYGKCIYTNGELNDYLLDSKDFDEVSYDEDEDIYTFRNEKYDSSDEAYSILLDEMIDNQQSIV